MAGLKMEEVLVVKFRCLKSQHVYCMRDHSSYFWLDMCISITLLTLTQFMNINPFNMYS